MKIYDCFTFFNEIELLETRLKYLYDAVDMFVVSESNLTHSGKEKEYNFKKHFSKFKCYSDKIIYLEYEASLPATSVPKPEKYDPNHWCWTIERGQRDFLSTALFDLDSDAVAVITDLDELWNLERREELLRAVGSHNVVRLGMSLHYFYFNYLGTGQLNKIWSHGFAINNSLIRRGGGISLSYIREGRIKVPVLSGMGWHFSYLGGAERVAEKLASFAHQELNNQEFNNRAHIERALDGKIDIFNRNGHSLERCELTYFPEGLAKLMKENPSFIKN